MTESVNRDALRELLKAKGRSARQVSREAKLGDTSVRDILNGKSKNPEFRTLQAIADALGEPVSSFTTPGAVTDQGADTRIVPKLLAVRFKVAAGCWYEPESAEPPAQFSGAAVPNPRYSQWPQWLELVVGDSVDLKIAPGRYAHVVDALEMGYQPKKGDWVVVERHRDQGAVRERTIKQVGEVTGGSVELWPRSTNPKWSKPISISSGVREGEDVEAFIVGLVVGSYDSDF